MHAALSFIFQMVEMGGSLLQKYDATSSSFIPNRLLTPFVLKPQLIISDPDGTIATADYATRMRDVSWTVSLTAGGSTTVLLPTDGSGVNYTIDSVTKALTLKRNVQPQEVVHLKFVGKYLDERRGEVHEFQWERDCSTEAQTDMNVTLDTGRWRGNVRLVPMRHWGQFGIPVQLKNGPDEIADTSAAYQWQWWDTTARSTIDSCMRTWACCSAGNESMMRSTVFAAPMVCSEESKRCPVSAAVIAVEMVSISRISPSMITSGASRKAALMARAKVDASSGTSRWLTRHFLWGCRYSILKWLKVFYRRFFSQQFKRSCLPDGPKVGSVAVSPRGDLRMPSDACVNVWMKELDEIEC